MIQSNHKIYQKNFWVILLLLLCLLTWIENAKKKKSRKKYKRVYTTKNPFTTRVCLKLEQALKARHKSCFLRPDTGPCRADIIQWYYDVRQKKCYRFFWGGCQGNGNRFETKIDCQNYCELNVSNLKWTVPHFCSLTFDYGNCFGYFNRWAWNPIQKACKQHLYSGCGGNQNNFETRQECLNTCLNPPNNTLGRSEDYTTCVPIEIPEIL